MFNLLILAQENQNSSFYEVACKKLMDFGPKLLAAIAILIIGRWVAKIIKSIVGKAMTRAKIEPTLVKFAQNLTFATAMVIVIISSIGALGVNTTSFVAIVGAAGLAVGLALQGSLSNFASGVLLVVFRPFKVGDFIEAAGTKGVIREIQIFNTIIDTPDNVKVVIPNGHITSGNIRNFSANANRRIDMVFGIAYKDNIEKAKKIIADIMEQEERILDEPKPTVKVIELGDSSVNLAVRPWVRNADYWDVYFNMTETVKNALDANGISIPFPQRDIHIINQAQSMAPDTVV
ncbi:MAG: mechanosensitive ion channel [Phycisphaerae bacterium]|nr:mechanosensitive ion channel [Phycisphaerae bacterium]